MKLNTYFFKLAKEGIKDKINIQITSSVKDFFKDTQKVTNKKNFKKYLDKLANDNQAFEEAKKIKIEGEYFKISSILRKFLDKLKNSEDKLNKKKHKKLIEKVNLIKSFSLLNIKILEIFSNLKEPTKNNEIDIIKEIAKTKKIYINGYSLFDSKLKNELSNQMKKIEAAALKNEFDKNKELIKIDNEVDSLQKDNESNVLNFFKKIFKIFYAIVKIFFYTIVSIMYKIVKFIIKLIFDAVYLALVLIVARSLIFIVMLLIFDIVISYIR